MVKELTFRSPGFFEREIDLSQRQQAPLGIPAGVIGTAERGPAFVPVTVGSFPDFVSRFGNLDPDRFGPYAVNEFLRNRSALTYVRVLGAGANDTTADIEKTRLTDQVKNAGFVVTGTLSDDVSWGGHVGAVQFIVAQHSVATNEAFGMPMFTDNNSVDNTLPKLVRGMVFLTSGTRLLIADGDSDLPGEFAGVDSKDDLATVNSDNKFKLMLSSSEGSAFATTDGLAGIKVFTASLDPTSADYIGKLLNTDPESFGAEHHLLWGDFAVDASIASASSNVAAVGVVSGTLETSTDSGDPAMLFRDMYGHFDTRYRAAVTPYVISQPFGATEYDLFRLESVDDGEYGNDKVKISITNIRKSPDPSNEFGVFSVVVRAYDDNDLNQQVLERYPDLNLDPKSDRFIGAVIGDRKAFYNFDAESEDERRIVVRGTYPNRSRYIRVVLSDDLLRGNVPARALPFGFRGYEVLKTTENNTDAGGAAKDRLGGVVTGSAAELTSSVLPPVPYRFKVTRGATSTSGFAGQPGSSEITNGNLHWGVKFERNTDVLNPNVSAESNRLVRSYTKLLGLQKLDALVTGSSADSFNNNKFTLARVALSNTAVSELTASAADHMREAAYIRNGEPDTTEYRVSDGVITNRLTLGSLVSLTSSVEFNKFTTFNKFSLFMQGGWDGVNILDPNARYLNDQACSFDADGGAEGTFLSPGLNSNANGVEQANSLVKSYRTAAQIITDQITSNINLLAIPGIRETFITDFVADQVRQYGLAMYVMDIEEYDVDQNRLFDSSAARPDVDKTADLFDGRAIDNNYVATYFPDVQIDDADNNRRVTVPASVAAMAALGFNDRVAFPWFAPAGFNRAALDFVENVQVRLNKDDRDRLQDSRINPIATFPRNGFVIFGQKTLQFAQSALDRVNVRRLLVEVKRNVADIASRLVFDSNTASNRLQFVNAAILQLGFIQSQAGIESFKVIMDESNNTQEDIENNRINGRIEIIPTRVVEFISIDFIITNSGVQFR